MNARAGRPSPSGGGHGSAVSRETGISSGVSGVSGAKSNEYPASDRNAVADRPPGLLAARIGSVPVYLRWSWFLIALAITILFAPTVRTVLGRAGAGPYLIAFLFAVLLLLSVLIHELAHAAVAAMTGTPASHIVLDLWGGHTAFGQDSITPWRSIAVSAAGPVSNLTLGLLAQAATGLSGYSMVPRLLLVATAYANFLVAGINALPGLPLDGGRVLEGLIWRATHSRVTGTLVAGWCGRIVALATAGAGVLLIVRRGHDVTSGVWLVLIAGLLWQGSSRAIGLAGWQRRAALLRSGDLLRAAVPVPSTATVASALTAAAQAGARAVVVLDVYGRPASIVDLETASQVPLHRTRDVTAAAVAQALPLGAVLPAGLGGDELISWLQGAPSARYAVVDQQEHVVGVLDWEDVARFVQART